MNDLQQGMRERKQARAAATKDWLAAGPHERKQLVADAKDLRYVPSNYERAYAWSILSWSTRTDV